MTSKTSYGPQVLAPPIGRTESNLTAKLAGDAAVGTGVTMLMAPFIATMDKAIAQRAAGTHTLMRSCRQSLHTMVTNPVAFARNPAFLYVWAVYAATYTTANSLKTLVEHQEKHSSSTKITVQSRHHQDGSSSSWGKMGIFFGTTAVNSGASLMKDRAFAQMFAAESASSVAMKVPLASYGFWMSRDLVGVGPSFVLPDLIARKLSAANPETEKQIRDMSQFCVPIATQLVAGPLHLLGLDLFNRPMADLSWKQMLLERSKFLMNGYVGVVGARVARIIPGYGFGGVLNSNLRDGWREYLIQRGSQEATLPGIPAPAIFSTMKATSVEL